LFVPAAAAAAAAPTATQSSCPLAACRFRAKYFLDP
jgi:hypothetical protein